MPTGTDEVVVSPLYANDVWSVDLLMNTTGNVTGFPARLAAERQKDNIMQGTGPQEIVDEIGRAKSTIDTKGELTKTWHNMVGYYEYVLHWTRGTTQGNVYGPINSYQL